MADDRVQIIIRSTDEQRDKIKDMAQERNVSMNPLPPTPIKNRRECPDKAGKKTFSIVSLIDK